MARAADSDGTLQHWHVTSGKCLHSTVEADNQLFCVDFREDGELFATAGKDKVVRIYDEATKTCTAQLSGGCAINPCSLPAGRGLFSTRRVPPLTPLMLCSPASGPRPRATATASSPSSSTPTTQTPS